MNSIPEYFVILTAHAAMISGLGIWIFDLGIISGSMLVLLSIPFVVCQQYFEELRNRGEAKKAKKIGDFFLCIAGAVTWASLVIWLFNLGWQGSVIAAVISIPISISSVYSKFSESNKTDLT